MPTTSSSVVVICSGRYRTCGERPAKSLLADGEREQQPEEDDDREQERVDRRQRDEAAAAVPGQRPPPQHGDDGPHEHRQPDPARRRRRSRVVPDVGARHRQDAAAGSADEGVERARRAGARVLRR
jgi:hypothetical protein